MNPCYVVVDKKRTAIIEEKLMGKCRQYAVFVHQADVPTNRKPMLLENKNGNNDL